MHFADWGPSTKKPQNKTATKKFNCNFNYASGSPKKPAVMNLWLSHCSLWKLSGRTGRFSSWGWNTNLRAMLLPSCSTGVRLRAFMSFSTTIKDKVKTNYCTFTVLSAPAMHAAHNSRDSNNAQLTGWCSTLCAAQNCTVGSVTSIHHA